LQSVRRTPPDLTGSWPVRTACPQCAGTVELEAGDPILSCGYCRTRLYLVSRGPLRYRLAAHDEAGISDVVWIPFWRFRGIRYRVLGDPARLEGGLLDATAAAFSSTPSNANLGIRPQVAPLTLDSGGGQIIKEDQTPAQALATVEQRVEALQTETPLFTRLIGESVCLVSAPCALEETNGAWRMRELIPDGEVHPLTDRQARALGSARRSDVDPQRVSFLPLLCPECGHDLAAAPGAVALLCGHCARGWCVRGNRFFPLPYAAQGAKHPGARYFPFWELTFRADGLPFSNRAELRRWIVSYQRVPAGWEREACQVLVPGFKLEPRVFVRLARIMSLASHEVSADSPPPGNLADTEPVRLTLSEAAQAVKVVVAFLAQGRRSGLASVAGARMRVRGARLLYLPFHRRGGEWVEEQTGAAIQSASVQHGSRL
jgi:hypothetical protein